ncbi:polyketide synthase [Actinophytocola gossypii]|uniref:Polyketide synthase n=1 Tax=Actinophytocola gossypii TaxID=2812003 RepID=A0ABT2J5I5_9PSEU|nr:polyketide synthase [Actinophytocola gossypii]MCT2583112.1 polyketide synthase [Actinophytocola gossypii]
MSTPVAIVGMDFRLPGSDTADEFWRTLTVGAPKTRQVPADRLVGYPAGQVGPAGLTAALLDDISCFDAKFFGIGRRMAVWMDPQQRLLLETSWRAMESAAIAPGSLRGLDVGVFVGSATNDFRDRMISEGVLDRYTAIGALPTYLSNRLSYHYDFRGPSYTVDTGCSSGLSALTMAVASLRAGDLDVALVGSANLCLSGVMPATLAHAGALSPSGSCRPFTDGADGYVRGEGVVSLVLKRLDDALADGDPVAAVIRGAATNHDGRRGGLIRPDADSQVGLVQRALRQAGLSASDIGYVEAHAPGTSADAVEVDGIRRLLATLPPGARGRAGPDGRTWVGSVKAVIGHLESAAAVASLVKAVLVLRHGQIPTAAGILSVGADLAVRHDPSAPPGSVIDWPAGSAPRRVGVSSFGIGGSNGHLVVEESPARRASAGRWRAGRVAVPLSAADEASLGARAAELADFLADPPPGCDLNSVAWTMQAGREQLPARAVVEASSLAELRTGLRALPEPGPAYRTWVNGGELDWAACWITPPAVRLSLPGTVFRRTHLGFAPETARRRAG